MQKKTITCYLALQNRWKNHQDGQQVILQSSLSYWRTLYALATRWRKQTEYWGKWNKRNYTQHHVLCSLCVQALLTDQWNKKSLCITHLSSHLALSAYTMCSSLCLLYLSRTHRPHHWGLGSAFCTVSASASSGLRKKIISVSYLFLKFIHLLP